MGLSLARKTPMMGSQVEPVRIAYPVAAGAVIYPGALVGVNSSGFLVPMTATTGLTCVGTAGFQVAAIPKNVYDNTNGGNAAFYIEVVRGVQFFSNYGSDPVVAADTMKICYAHSDFEVAHTASGLSPAGFVIAVVAGTEPGADVIGAGIWVQVGMPMVSTSSQGATGATGATGGT